MNDYDFISAIEGVVTWYSKLPRDFSDINHLMSARRSLACNLALMSSQVGALYEQKNGAETLRKAKHYAILRSEMDKSGVSASQAKINADSEILKELERESDTDSEYRKAWILYESWKNVCDVMSQHVSNLKAERASEMTGQGSQH